MTLTVRDAARSLDETAKLFDLALARAGDDADAVNRLLDAATALLDLAGPAINCARGSEYETAVRQAAERARHSHERLAQTLGLELGRIADELARLNAGSVATAGYASPVDTGKRAGLNLVG